MIVYCDDLNLYDMLVNNNCYLIKTIDYGYYIIELYITLLHIHCILYSIFKKSFLISFYLYNFTCLIILYFIILSIFTCIWEEKMSMDLEKAYKYTWFYSAFINFMCK